jgi:hypothetical protein
MAIEIQWNRRPLHGRKVMDGLRQACASCLGLQGCEMNHAVVARKGFSDRPKSGPLERFIDLWREKP